MRVLKNVPVKDVLSLVETGTALYILLCTTVILKSLIYSP